MRSIDVESAAIERFTGKTVHTDWGQLTMPITVSRPIGRVHPMDIVSGRDCHRSASSTECQGRAY